MAKGHSPSQGQHYADGLIWLGSIIQRSVKSSAVTVTSSATLIPTSPLDRRKTLLIRNISAAIVYIGASDVTSSNGFPIYPRGSIQFAIEASVDIYGVTATTAALRILEGA